MIKHTSSPITEITIPHPFVAVRALGSRTQPSFPSAERSTRLQQVARARAARILIRPQPGFYLIRLGPGTPLVPALIYRLCPMVLPQPSVIGGPHPDDWCRPLDRSPQYRALIDGKPAAVDRVWTARSLRLIAPDEYRFRSGELRHWARAQAMPEARPRRRIDLATLPPLF